MKRTVILVCGVATLLGVAAIVSKSKLVAQAPATTAPAAQARPAELRTRIALLNLSHVLKSYNKAQAFQNEIKVAVEPYQKREMGLKAEGDKLAQEMNDPKTAPDQRDVKERRLKELQRLLEDNKVEASKVVGKKTEEQLKILFMDIRDIAERYAKAHNFDMVLHYNDHVDARDYWSPQNIMRKIQAGSLMPLYYGPGQDISADVIGTLNASYKPAAAPAGGAPAAGGTN